MMLQLVLWLVTVGCALGQDDRVLVPIRQQGLDVGLTVLPGAGLTYDQYRELGSLVQSANPYRLWVYLSDTPTTPSNTVQRGRDMLMAAGMPRDAPFFATGHSMGAGTIVNEVDADPSLADGLITWGGILLTNRLTKYPVPVLTINGDLDGFLTGRITSATRQFRKLNELEPDAIYQFPMVTVVGTNHGQYATGEMPINVELLDLPADKDGPVARKEVADYTSIFITYLVKKNFGEDVANEEEILREMYQLQSEISKPIIEVFDLQADESLSESVWLVEAQRIMAGLDSSVEVRNEIVRRGELSGLQPTIRSNPDGSTYIQTYAAMNKGLTSIAQAYDTIDAKMLSGLSPVQCRDINIAAWNTAYNLASDTAKQRFDDRKYDIIFEDDDVRTSEFRWNSANLNFNSDGVTLRVRSPSYISPDRHYCKLLSPAKALEFMYVDGLRR